MGESSKFKPGQSKSLLPSNTSPQRSRRASGVARNKLPWLESEAATTESTTPLSSQQNDAALSPLGGQSTTPQTPRQSVSTRRKASVSAAPTRSPTSPGKQRVDSRVERGSPSSARRISKTRRVFFSQETLPPARTFSSVSKSYGSPRRLSSIHSPVIDSAANDTRPRVGSLAQVPDHLERPSSPDSMYLPNRSDISPMKSPAFISVVHSSPTQPVPDRSSFSHVNNRKISQTVDDLEAMVQEAVEMVDDSNDRGQVAEIYEIIEEAKKAIQEVSNDPVQHLMATTSPLRVSPEDEGETSDSSLLSDSSGRIDNMRRHRLGKISRQGTISSQLDSQQRTEAPRGSVSYDWAYPGGNNELPTPPNVQAAPRDHTEFVLRPQTQVRSRDYSHQPLIEDNTPHARRHGGRNRHRTYRPISSGPLDTSYDLPDRSADPYEHEVSFQDPGPFHTFRLHRHHRRQPIARNWSTGKKRLTATITCINTTLLGIIIGIYAGEVPRIQYFLADERHIVVIGNAVLYFGLALTTFIVWPLPLLHGRKPYMLTALALALPLQFPQAIIVSGHRSPKNPIYRTGLLCSRAALGLVLGFANVNYVTILLDLFGASLQSKNPHQEFVVASDIRRHGGGMGLWLGIWSWCWIGSLAVGFQVGAAIIESLTPDWGFYIIVMILVAALILNIMAPETRRAPYRKSVTELYDRDENYITRRVSRGEVKLHISTEGPKYWFEEVWAGMKLMVMMMRQPGFLVLSFYLSWIYAQIVLVIILLGALLSRDYRWKPRYVGAGVMSIAIGAFLAIPLTKAGIFSRERKSAFRTDSMTFQKQVTWSSHLVRRVIFTLTLPLMGLAYTISSAGAPKPYMVPIVFAGAVGFLSILAIAECYGLIMETFDTCDLQPGVNTKHRLESMAVQDRRRRTNYTSFPRVTAGIFASQSLAFIGAGIATLVGGSMTRHLGAQASTGVTAGILLGLTILLTAVLWRFKEVQVIPNHTFGTRRDTAAWEDFKQLEKMGRGADWKAVVIGNPSGKMRRMSALELGSLSRWTEIRKLNFLLKGPVLGEGKKARGFGKSY